MVVDGGGSRLRAATPEQEKPPGGAPGDGTKLGRLYRLALTFYGTRQIINYQDGSRNSIANPIAVRRYSVPDGRVRLFCASSGSPVPSAVRGAHAGLRALQISAGGPPSLHWGVWKTDSPISGS
jgi:hypothetical protein